MRLCERLPPCRAGRVTRHDPDPAAELAKALDVRLVRHAEAHNGNSDRHRFTLI
jgi:hypothetical protein